MACSCCAFGNTADEHFNADEVAKELAQYRRKGPGPTTRRLRDGLVSAGLREGTVLDVGGGLGTLSLELGTLATPFDEAYNVEAVFWSGCGPVASRQHGAEFTVRRSSEPAPKFRSRPRHDTLENLHDQRLVEAVDLGDGERGLTLTAEGRHLLDSHSLERDDKPSQVFYAGVSRSREIDHDSNLYSTFRQEEARLRTAPVVRPRNSHA